MNSYASLKVDVSHHAYLQYCDRVEPIESEDLSEQCRSKVREGDFSRGKGGWFIQIGGVWWVYRIQGDVMTLITCYGRTTMDLPLALKWAHRNNDDINLQHMVTLHKPLEVPP